MSTRRVTALNYDGVIGDAVADVARHRERARRRRLGRLGVVLGVPATYLWYRALTGRPFDIFRLPSLGPDAIMFLPAFLLIAVVLVAVLVPFMGQGRSPHVTYRPEDIDTGLADVKGLGSITEEVVKTLNLFLGHQLFRDEMGGTPRRGVLFEGPPGTGKTYVAKAMAKEAGVPFLFVSSSAFQSMYYGQTGKKIRSFFKALRKAARTEGGAIGFIEEIDAIGAARGGVSRPALSHTSAPDGALRGWRAPGMDTHRAVVEGTGGVVNELLIQMQSFDEPPRGVRMRNGLRDMVNLFLAPKRRLRRHKGSYTNILVVGATNRADALDPGLLRPGRFDRVIHFGLPNRDERRAILDYYLDRKAHEPELDVAEKRDEIAAMTFGYSPVMLEHLLDEGLVWAIRRGADTMVMEDISRAKFTQELGLEQPVTYTDEEKRMIATHESGHAAVAFLVGKSRKLEVLSVIKRGNSLGLLGHSDKEERFTNTKSELIARIDIALGGMAAEEIAFGESGTGPSGDLVAATQVAAAMVGSLGMAGSLVSYDAVEGMSTNTVGKVLAHDEGRKRVEEILATEKDAVVGLLQSSWHLVEALRDALIEREELIGDEILDVLLAADLRVRPETPARADGAQPKVFIDLAGIEAQLTEP